MPLPKMVTEPSVKYENTSLGTLELKGAFLWVAIILVVAVVVE